MLKYLLVGVLALTVNASYAGELNWSFKSPAFHYGNGYSNHVLSVEQLQFQRKQEMEDKKRSELARLEREMENTTLNKFIKNVESRIYATLSKQMVDSMFQQCTSSNTNACPTSGTTEIEGSTISWVKDNTTGEITLTVVNDDGTTTIKIPGSGEFFF